ncbi:MAG TPA: hypothetical protein VGY76_10665 [Solirubrobacteraceae bacterium]|jgi:hypothetical protein|nr:hypothetical protein [Solirubrobacteraceae bacterium]
MSVSDRHATWVDPDEPDEEVGFDEPMEPWEWQELREERERLYRRASRSGDVTDRRQPLGDN